MIGLVGVEANLHVLWKGSGIESIEQNSLLA